MISGRCNFAARRLTASKSLPSTKQLHSLTAVKHLAPGLAFRPLVTVQDQLGAERGIAAHADRHMTPFAIHDVDTLAAFSGVGTASNRSRNQFAPTSSASSSICGK